MCDRISNQFYGRWLQFNVDTNWNGIIVIEVISGGVVVPDHDLLLTYCSAPTPTYEFYDRWDSVQLLNFWKSLLLRLNCRSVLHFKASKRPNWRKKWDVYQVIYNLAIWSNSARFAGWQKRIASDVAATWTANDLSHSHQIPILLTLPPHSKSDHTNNTLLTNKNTSKSAGAQHNDKMTFAPPSQHPYYLHCCCNCWPSQHSLALKLQKNFEVCCTENYPYHYYFGFVP